MARIRYNTKKMRADRQRIAEQAEAICREYDVSLTVRQVYYQFVARGMLENIDANYNMLQSVISDARMAGLFDWDLIIDRTRNLQSQPTWRSPSELVRSAADRYATDMWRPQRHRVEVWIEKDAGIGVIEAVCNANQVSFIACRGYISQSEMWAAGQRVGDYLRRGERVTILHVGDHDPSGLDMTRDMKERLATFVLNDWKREFLPGPGWTSADIYRHMRTGMRQVGSTITDDQAPFRIKRIALSYEQVLTYGPPPNPAKQTDSRFRAYEEETGLHESWELDALDPTVLQDLIQSEIDAIRDGDLWDRTEQKQETERAVLQAVSNHWSDIVNTYRDEVPGMDEDDNG